MKQRGSKVRYVKNPKTNFFRKQMPEALNREIVEAHHGSYIVKQSHQDKTINRNPDMPGHKQNKEQELIEKEAPKKKTIKK